MKPSFCALGLIQNPICDAHSFAVFQATWPQVTLRISGLASLAIKLFPLPRMRLGDRYARAFGCTCLCLASFGHWLLEAAGMRLIPFSQQRTNAASIMRPTALSPALPARKAYSCPHRGPFLRKRLPRLHLPNRLWACSGGNLIFLLMIMKNFPVKSTGKAHDIVPMLQCLRQHWESSSFVIDPLCQR